MQTLYDWLVGIPATLLGSALAGLLILAAPIAIVLAGQAIHKRLEPRLGVPAAAALTVLIALYGGLIAFHALHWAGVGLLHLGRQIED